MAFKEFTLEEAKIIGDKLNIDWNKIDISEFKKGLRVELEHGSHDSQTNITDDDTTATGKIALAHLKEIPTYYTLLEKMEAEAESLSGPVYDTRGED